MVKKLARGRGHQAVHAENEGIEENCRCQHVMVGSRDRGIGDEGTLAQMCCSTIIHLCQCETLTLIRASDRLAACVCVAEL